MAVTTTISTIDYDLPSGITAPSDYSYPYQILSTDNLIATYIFTDESLGQIVFNQLTQLAFAATLVGATVTINQTGVDAITAQGGLGAPGVLHINRDIPVTQEIEFTNNSRLNIRSFEEGLDKMTLIFQDLVNVSFETLKTEATAQALEEARTLVEGELTTDLTNIVTDLNNAHSASIPVTIDAYLGIELEGLVQPLAEAEATTVATTVATSVANSVGNSAGNISGDIAGREAAEDYVTGPLTEALINLRTDARFDTLFEDNVVNKPLTLLPDNAIDQLGYKSIKIENFSADYSVADVSVEGVVLQPIDGGDDVYYLHAATATTPSFIASGDYRKLYAYRKNDGTYEISSNVYTSTTHSHFKYIGMFRNDVKTVQINDNLLIKGSITHGPISVDLDGSAISTSTTLPISTSSMATDEYSYATYQITAQPTDSTPTANTITLEYNGEPVFRELTENSSREIESNKDSFSEYLDTTTGLINIEGTCGGIPVSQSLDLRFYLKKIKLIID